MIQLMCRTCQRPAPVQWVKEERRYRFQRHNIDPMIPARCPASGEPVTARRRGRPDRGQEPDR